MYNVGSFLRNLSVHLTLRYFFVAFQIGAIYLWVYAYNVVRISVEASLKAGQRTEISVENSSISSSIAEPISFREPLLSQNDAVTSEQKAGALPLTRSEKNTQVAYCFKISLLVPFCYRKLMSTFLVICFLVSLVPFFTIEYTL